MSTILKHIVAHTYKPLLVKYLSKTRVYRYQDIRMEIPPEVFHPGFFFSTQLLLQYISSLPLQEKYFLELGCGSGLISMVAAKQGAIVTATEINPVAIEYLKKNSRHNKVKLEIIESDLFNDVPKKQYDIIAINPPYYKKDPVTSRDYAWFCGENGEYFSALFDTIDDHIHSETEILMVLFDGCDMDMITGFAAKKNFALNCVYSKQNMLEKNFIYKIEKIDE
ncbi:MAG: methyltransferase [Ferruginibacter sp.]